MWVRYESELAAMDDELHEAVALGVYDPDSPTADQRRELLEHLFSRGFSAAQISAATVHAEQFTDVAVYLENPSQPWLTWNEVARTLDTTVAEIAAFRSALGFVAPASADTADLPSSFVEDFSLYQLACELYGRESTLELVRVVGVAVATITEGARALFTAPLRESAATELDISVANELGVAAWHSARTLVGNLMAERTGRDSWFEADLLRGDLSVAIAFVDLVGSTSWTAGRSRAEHRAALSRFESAATRLAASNGARVVKFIGDEAMIVAREPHVAVAVTIALCAEADRDDDLPSARGAVAFGQVTARSGDYFGSVVNLASRLVGAAAPGSVVVTSEVAGALDPRQWSLGTARRVHLDGIDDPVDAFEVALRV